MTGRRATPHRIGRGIVATLVLALASCLSVRIVDPPAAAPGEEIAIEGIGFGEEQGAGGVSLDGVEAEITGWSERTVRAVVPAGLAGSVELRVRTADGPSVVHPFRVLEAPLAGAVEAPRIDVGADGVAELLVGRDGALLLLERGAGTWSEPDEIDALDGDYDLAVDELGGTHVLYERLVEAQFPSLRLAGLHRVRAGGSWSEPEAMCSTGDTLTPACHDPRLVALGDGALAAFAYGSDRYGTTWITRYLLDGGSWSGGSSVESGSAGSGIAGYEAANVGGAWRVALARSRFDWSTGEVGYEAAERAELGPGSLLATDDTEPFGVPGLASDGALVHYVWWQAGALVHRSQDATTGETGEVTTVATVSGRPRPVVVADAAEVHALWIDDGALTCARLVPASGGWSEAFVIATGAAAPLDASRADGVTHVAWRAGDDTLRYTTLP